MDLKEMNMWMNAMNAYFVSDDISCKMNYIMKKMETLEQERGKYRENIKKDIDIKSLSNDEIKNDMDMKKEHLIVLKNKLSESENELESLRNKEMQLNQQIEEIHVMIQGKEKEFNEILKALENIEDKDKLLKIQNEIKLYHSISRMTLFDNDCENISGNITDKLNPFNIIDKTNNEISDEIWNMIEKSF